MGPRRRKAKGTSAQAPPGIAPDKQLSEVHRLATNLQGILVIQSTQGDDDDSAQLENLAEAKIKELREALARLIARESVLPSSSDAPPPPVFREIYHALAADGAKVDVAKYRELLAEAYPPLDSKIYPVWVPKNPRPRQKLTLQMANNEPMSDEPLEAAFEKQIQSHEARKADLERKLRISGSM